MRTVVAVASACAVTGLAVVAGPTATAAPTDPVVGWVACFDSDPPLLTYKPRRHVLSCADANSGLRRLHWSSWDEDDAEATGVYYWNDCEPTCAAGENHTSKATVRLSRPKVQHGEKVFTRVVVRYTDEAGKPQVDRSTALSWPG